MAKAPAPVPPATPPDAPIAPLTGLAALIARRKLGKYEKPKAGAKSAADKAKEMRKNLVTSLGRQLQIFETGQTLTVTEKRMRKDKATGKAKSVSVDVEIGAHWDGTLEKMFFPVKYGNRILRQGDTELVFETNKDDFPVLIAELIAATEAGDFDASIATAFARGKK